MATIQGQVFVAGELKICPKPRRKTTSRSRSFLSASEVVAPIRPVLCCAWQVFSCKTSSYRRRMKRGVKFCRNIPSGSPRAPKFARAAVKLPCRICNAPLTLSSLNHDLKRVLSQNRVQGLSQFKHKVFSYINPPVPPVESCVYLSASFRRNEILAN